jgi:signal transduction histidine kinase
MTAGSCLLLTPLAAVAIAIGSLSTIAVLQMRRRLIQRVGEHAAHLSREAERQTDRAVHDERIRIEREVQAIVAHPLVVVTTLADGASLTVRKDPAIAAEAMNQAAATSRQALKDLRRFVSGLRDESDRSPNRSRFRGE